MTFTTLKIFNYISIITILFSCSNSKDYSMSKDKSYRSDLLELYLETKKNIIKVPEDVNIYFVYTTNSSRCECQPIDEIILLLKEYKNNIVIMNEIDSTSIKTFDKYAQIYIEEFSLRKYGLIAPINQLFLLRNNTVIYKTLIDTDNHNKILKKVKK